MNYQDDFVDGMLFKLRENAQIFAQERRTLIANAHQPNAHNYNNQIDRFTPGGEFLGRFQYIVQADTKRTIDVVRVKTFAWWVNRHIALYAAAFLLSFFVMGACALALVPWRWPTEADITSVIVGVITALAFLHASRERKNDS